MDRKTIVQRRQRDGLEREVQRRLGLIENMGRGRKGAQRERVMRLDRSRTIQVRRGVFRAVRVEQQAAGMIGEVEILRCEITGLCRKADRLFIRTDRCQSAAGVAISFDPIRLVLQQLLIGRSRFGKTTAITKQPSTEMDDVVVIRRRSKGPSAALTRFSALRPQ
jgi:hypothetical protein